MYLSLSLKKISIYFDISCNTLGRILHPLLGKEEKRGRATSSQVKKRPPLVEASALLFSFSVPEGIHKLKREERRPLGKATEEAEQRLRKEPEEKRRQKNQRDSPQAIIGARPSHD